MMWDSEMTKSLSIEGWTTEDKFNLLQAFKANGSHDIQKICEYLPGKSPVEVKFLVDQYKKIAQQHPIIQKMKTESKRQSHNPTVSLTAWAKFLTDNIPLEELTTVTSTAVRMIAELEDLPEPHLTGGIDFRKIYHTIANAMEGKPLEADEMTIAVLNKCIVHTALESKSFMNTNTLKDIMTSIGSGLEESNQLFELPDTEALALLRTLAVQRNINPLQIPEKYLKPFVDNAQPYGATGDKPEKKENKYLCFTTKLTHNI